VLCWPLLNSRIIEQEHLLGLLLLVAGPASDTTLQSSIYFMHACLPTIQLKA
jgi:hypothetical protein